MVTARAEVATQAAKTWARARGNEAQSGLGRGLTAGRARLAEMGPRQCCGLRAGGREARLTKARDGGNGGSDQGLATAAAEAGMAQATTASAGGSGGSDDSGLRYGRENMK